MGESRRLAGARIRPASILKISIWKSAPNRRSLPVQVRPAVASEFSNTHEDAQTAVVATSGRATNVV
jgi:hypothetical protein